MGLFFPAMEGLRIITSPLQEKEERFHLQQELSKLYIQEAEALQQTLLDMEANGEFEGSDMLEQAAELSDSDEDPLEFKDSQDPGFYEDISSRVSVFRSKVARLRARAEFSALNRKYKNLRRQVEEDSLLFADAAFDIQPATGVVWAHSEVEFTVAFTPDVAAEFACTAYLEVRRTLALRSTYLVIRPRHIASGVRP